jgi:hypothetical protein
MKWWKCIFLKFIHMTAFNKIVKELKTRGISPLNKEEEQIAIFHLSLKQNIYSIVHLISHQRNRAKLISKLKELGINEGDLTEDELNWIEEVLSAGSSIDNAADEIKKARDNKRSLASPKSIV